MKTSMVTIIQARMNSSRFPGKVLKEVCGRSLLSHMILRLNLCKDIGRVVVATTTDKNDDVLAEYTESLNVDVFRGDEDDVLARYYAAAQHFGAKHVMRLTADCPLIDPHVCDLFVQTYFKKKVDYVNSGLSFAEGMSGEVFSFETLQRSYNEAELMSEREHVTLYIKNQPKEFSIYTIENETDDSCYRLTVDEPEDLEVIKRIFEKFYPKHGEKFSYKQIKTFLDQNPDIARINAHILRKEGLYKSLKKDFIFKDH